MIKVELHCHIEGAADPVLVSRLAKKYNLDLNDVVRDGRYVWSDFTSFLNAYDKASNVFREPEDYRLLAYDHYLKLAEQGAIYGEIFGSPDHAALMGISYGELVDALDAGINDAKLETGIEGRIIMTCVRHLGPAAAEAVADTIAANPHPCVTGFGMGGDERMFETADFASAFRICSDAGLGLTTHAGEFRGPKSIVESLDLLEVSRIGHGVRAIEDMAVVERLVHDGIVLEVCPQSNIRLGVYRDYAAHPLRQLFDAGVRLTINSDDPPFFETTLAQEYELVEVAFGFSEAEIAQCTQTAIKAAFLDQNTRKKLLSQLNNVG